MSFRILLLAMVLSVSAFAQVPPIEPGVSQELAKWRAARYSNVRYKLNLTLEKMSAVLKGTMEIRVTVGNDASSVPPAVAGGALPIVLDWRKIRGHEGKSTISNVSINGKTAVRSSSFSWPPVGAEASVGSDGPPKGGTPNFGEYNEHLIFSDGVVMGENVIKLDFTSPILTSGSAMTRYVDKEDGSEYLYSLFVPSDASTAFPVFDQPDIKAKFELFIDAPKDWHVVSNTQPNPDDWRKGVNSSFRDEAIRITEYRASRNQVFFHETKPISTYVFAFAAGPWERVSSPHVSKGSGDGSGASLSQEPFLTVGLPTPAAVTGGNASVNERVKRPSDAPKSTKENLDTLPNGRVSALSVSSPRVSKGARDQQAPSLTVGLQTPESSIYVRKSQAAKFKPHAAEVFRLNREAIKYFEEYFDYEFPWPKYDLVLIPEFPFGGMEHAGATFLRESSIIFPQEPTKNDHISRALLMFHEASHQWFGDTVTMRWFDDLWLKEGFATFTAYKALEKIMPEMLAWKVFYERVKQAAYQTDSTRGTTAIYQPIANLSAAKSAYGNIVYNKAPAFLRQAEFYLGEDKFQTAVRAFLKKHEFGNAGWEDLVKEFETASDDDLQEWANVWVKERGLPLYRLELNDRSAKSLRSFYVVTQDDPVRGKIKVEEKWRNSFKIRESFRDGEIQTKTYRPVLLGIPSDSLAFSIDNLRKDPASGEVERTYKALNYVLPNYQDYGYGIFLLDEKSREYVLKNIQNEKDPFLRSMMWGALWDSVREGELDPREYVELVVKVLQKPARTGAPAAASASGVAEQGLNTQVGSKALANARASAIDDESTTALLLGRVGTAMNYYIDEAGTQAPSPASAQRAETGSAAKVTRRPADTVQAGSLRSRVEDMLIERMQKAETLGQRITYYRAFLNIASNENARKVLKGMLTSQLTTPSAEAAATPPSKGGESRAKVSDGKVKPPATAGGTDSGRAIPLRTKDKFDIVTKLLILNDPEAPKLLAELEKTETSDDAKRYAYAAKAGIATAENKAKYWNDFVNNKEISESWIEAAFGPWNSIRHSELTLPYLERALKELPNHKRNRKIFFVNGWLGAFIGGQRSEEALAIVNKFLADNPGLDNDLRLKILENVDVIERGVRIRKKF